MEIKAGFSSCVIEKDVIVNFMLFEHCVLLIFKAPVAETSIYHVLKIVFLQSTVNRLSVDALLVHHYRPWR